MTLITPRAPLARTSAASSATIFDGEAVQSELVRDARATAVRHGVVPRLALLAIASPDPLLPVTVSLHTRVLGEAGIDTEVVVLPPGSTGEELHSAVDAAQADPAVDGVMVLLPLPDHVDIRDALAWIDPEREVEGLHPEHARALLAVSPAGGRRPVAAEAVLEVVRRLELDLTDASVVVLVDAGLMANNPVANLVARAAAPAALPVTTALTIVPVTHPRAAELSRSADVLVVSVETAGIVTADWVAPGAVVIDFNPVVVGSRPHPVDPDRRLPVIAGGVAVDDVASVAGTVCAIPGGVGPVMLGVLAREVVALAVRRRTGGEAPGPELHRAGSVTAPDAGVVL